MNKAATSSKNHEGKGSHWPVRAYVPGENERHPEDFFDEIKRSVNSDQSVLEVSQSRAFLFGFQLFRNGYYWEAHEVWEPVWLAIPDSTQERHFVQALIQITNAYLKLRMQRPKAAGRLCVLARELLSGCDGEELMGVRKDSMIHLIQELEGQINL